MGYILHQNTPFKPLGEKYFGKKCFLNHLNGHESWVMTKRVRSQVQASEIRFLRRIEGIIRFNKLRSFVIRRSLNIDPLLFRIEKYQLRWLCRL